LAKLRRFDEESTRCRLPLLDASELPLQLRFADARRVIANLLFDIAAIVYTHCFGALRIKSFILAEITERCDARRYFKILYLLATLIIAIRLVSALRDISYVSFYRLQIQPARL
jgi:hypothetical protein